MECALTDIEDAIPKPMNLFKDQTLMESVVVNMLKIPIKNQKEMGKFIRKEQQRIHESIAHNQLLYTYRCMIRDKKVERNKHYEQFLKSKVVRESSGICQITVVMGPGFKTLEDDAGNKVELNRDPLYSSERTQRLAKEHKHYSCPFNCFYCPDQPGQPRSYLKTEPAVQRANQFDFDPILQFRERTKAIIINGMEAVKIELNIKGGTFSEYDDTYRTDFVHKLYYAANTMFDKDFEKNPRLIKTLEDEIKINETALCGIIGLTVEARPDSIKPEELIKFRRMGITRFEMGVQSIFDTVLKYVNRGCKHQHSVKAMKLLKDNGFKVDIHIMFDLPSSNPDMDKETVNYLVDSPDLQPDQTKLYPCTVVPFTKIEIWYNNYIRNYDTELNPEGLSNVDNRIYKPYAEENLQDIIIEHGKTKLYSTPLIELLIYYLSRIQPWVRVNRIIRDIPGQHYVKMENYHEDMRQILDKEMKKRNLKCMEIRTRELKDKKVDINQAQLVVRKYEASGGTEYFISFETSDQAVLFGFLRLRISKDAGSVFSELKNTAMIRELHVYGKVIPVSQQNESTNKAQHKGFGKQLIKKAEEIALDHGYTRISVIAGVNTRPYYNKLSYLNHPGDGHFQIKTLTRPIKITNIIIPILFVLLSIFILYIYY
ncbi:radical SAM superfamily protein [Klosneuvirus KNV1]|uniref:tRNA carboxymethyluridine synthase n=1 Tax=Klosneuvirus KNV1 TaxID=1977640 RepID=A0A1V0SKT9_9VIRU|nr:radical SAM superfamily protein [Klosneuvirus KNV1]